jgi:small subunit ribosomal protein S1
MGQKAMQSLNNASFSMEDFEKALLEHDYQYAKGQIVTGRAFSYESDGALIDIGGKSPAFLPVEEASVRRVNSVESVLPLQEERNFLIVREQNAEGQVTVSLKALEFKKIWDRLLELQEANQSIQVRVTSTNKGGVTVDALGLRGFIPRSHLVERENLEALVGQSLSASFLEVDREKKKVVLSNRLASRSEKISQLEVGQLISGVVTGMKPFGAFVEFDGTTGLIQITEVSDKYVKALESVFQIGQPIKAMIVNLDEGRGRIGLSTKVLENHPGEVLENLAQVIEEAESREERARKKVLER